MKTLILIYVLVVSISAMADGQPTPAPGLNGIIVSRDCPELLAPLQKNESDLAAKQKECDGIHKELLDLHQKKMDAEAKVDAPNSTVDDGYAYYNARQAESAKGKEVNNCSDQWWKIFDAHADIIASCRQKINK